MTSPDSEVTSKSHVQVVDLVAEDQGWNLRDGEISRERFDKLIGRQNPTGMAESSAIIQQEIDVEAAMVEHF